MRVEDARTERGPGGVERSVRLAWIGGEARLWVRAPTGLEPSDGDLTAFVPVALLLAMRRAEPLQIDGAVSARLLDQLSLAQEAVSAWDPTYARIPVRAAERAEPAAPAAGRASCFSRGVDSMYSAAVPRRPERDLTHLLFCDTLEPSFGEETRRAETAAARDAARRVGKELVVLSTNVTEVIHGVVDYQDAYGAILAMLGLSMPACIGHLTIPSSGDYGQLVPVGSHPLLDPLWSSEAVEVEHDSCALGRPGKVRWLVESRPDLLPLVHVCWNHDSTENCGRCSKCLLTMVLLQAAGGLETAGSFPANIDLEVLRSSVRVPDIFTRLYLNDVLRALPPGPQYQDLRRTLEEMLRACAAAPNEPSPHGMLRHQTRLFRALDAGRPFLAQAAGGPAPEAEVAELDPAWPPPRDVPAGLLGLVVGVDLTEERHVYGVGAVPAATRVGELGAALVDPPVRSLPLRVDAEARPVVPELGEGRPSVAAAIRWAVAPLGWRGTSPLARVRSAGRRTLQSARTMARRQRARNVAVTAWLHEDAGRGRVPLYAARHPVLDDVLLSTEAETAGSLGYRNALLLGYLEAHAPVTGSLGVQRRALPWAHRWGL